MKITTLVGIIMVSLLIGLFVGLILPKPKNITDSQAIIEHKTSGEETFYVVTKVFRTKEQVDNWLKVYKVKTDGE